ncbi:hypothetical protein [Roseateles noduli]|uniref:hypothetical protein n=1 Tax=Roseateles noduli TaxID=2052484 RepID=UPI003D64E862
MSANLDLLPGAPAPLTLKGSPAPRAHDRRVRPDEDERLDEAATESGSVPADSPAASTLATAASPDASAVPDAPAVPDAAAMPDGDGGSAEAHPAASAAGGERHDDRSSALLAAGLGLLGIGGAAGLAGATAAGDSKPIGAIDPPKFDPPKSDQPKSDPPVSEQKPDSGTSTPGTDQPPADPPPADQSHTGQSPQPDPGTSDPDPAQPADPAQQPPAPVPVAPTLSLAVDTGRSGQDHITSSGAVNVSGLEPGATLSVSLDDGKTWTSRSGDEQLPEALFGADGVKHLEVRQIDAKGNAGEVAELSFTLDRTAPDALHWSLPNDKAALGLADTIAVQGVETDAIVQYRPDTQTPWLVAAGSLIPVSMFQHDGSGQVEVRQIDVAGNESASTTLVATVDVTAPAVPTLSLAVDSGLDHHDRVTAAGSVNVEGLEPNASLSISLDGGQTWTPRGGDTQLPEALFGADGLKQLLVKQIDASGNGSDAAQLSFQLDRTAPGELQWTMPAGKPALGIDDAIQVHGAETNALVEYRLDPAAQWFPANNGRIPVSVFHQDGTQQLQVRQSDLAGNDGPVTTFNVPVDVTPPNTPTLKLLNDTGVSSTDGITSSGKVHVDGLEGGATLLVSTNGGDWQAFSEGTTVVDSDWLFPFGGGKPSLLVKQVDAAGNASDAASLSFTLDNQALNPSWMSSGKDHSGGEGPAQVTLGAHDFFQVNRYSGWDARQDAVSYRVDGSTWKEVPADGRLPLSAFGADGKHQLEMRETDLAGNVAIRPVEITLDTSPPNAPQLSLEHDDGVSSTDLITSNPIVLVGGLQLGDTFRSRTNGGEWGPSEPWVPGVGTGGWVIGSNTVEVYAIDAAGNAGPTSQLTYQYQFAGAVI